MTLKSFMSSSRFIIFRGCIDVSKYVGYIETSFLEYVAVAINVGTARIGKTPALVVACRDDFEVEVHMFLTQHSSYHPVKDKLLFVVTKRQTPSTAHC